MYIVFFLTLFGSSCASEVPTEIETKNTALAVTEFSIDLLKNVYEEGKNTFFSGYSIALAMGMVSLGARENTLTEIDKTLHFDKVNANDPKAIHKMFKSSSERYNKPNHKYNLGIATRLYGQMKLKIEEQFQNEVNHYYHSGFQRVDFSSGIAEDVINGWVAEQTNGKIKKLFLPKSFDINTVLVLVNAIYFKGNWDKQFQTNLTSNRHFFTTKSTTVEVEMMKQRGEFKHFNDWNLKVRVLELPYVGKDLSMFIFLPTKFDGLLPFIQSLTATELESLMNSVQYTNLTVDFPKFKLETKYSLKDSLKKLGIHDLFDQRCDVSGIVDHEMDDKVEVSEVRHKAFIQVDEEGTEAAAVTGIDIVFRSDKDVFIVNHPFLFVIRDSIYNLPLFIGTVNDPTAV